MADDAPTATAPAVVDETSKEIKEESSSTTETHEYKFNVKMSCGGCSGAINRVLKKLEGDGGIQEYEVSLENQNVKVKADAAKLSYDAVLRTIAKTGKTVTYGEVDGKEKSIEVKAEA